MGATISDFSIATKIFANLPNNRAYEGFRATFEMLHDSNLTKLREEIEKKELRYRHNKTESALFTSQRVKTGKQRPAKSQKAKKATKCYDCGSDEHIRGDENCEGKVCFTCGATDHIFF
jgi:hypothetical protein